MSLRCLGFGRTSLRGRRRDEVGRGGNCWGWRGKAGIVCSGGDSSGGDSSGGDSSGGDSAAPTDLDADGYALAEDCDDNNAAVNPGAEEVCDELDNNCDGLIDVDAIDAQTFYGDADEDGYAGDAVTVAEPGSPKPSPSSSL